MSTDVEEYPICPCLNLIELKLILVHFSAFQYVLFQSTSRALVVLYSLSSTFLFCFTERNAIMLLLVVVLVTKLECGPMPKLMVALPNIGGALCSTQQSLVDAHY